MAFITQANAAGLAKGCESMEWYRPLSQPLTGVLLNIAGRWVEEIAPTTSQSKNFRLLMSQFLLTFCVYKKSQQQMRIQC